MANFIDNRYVRNSHVNSVRYFRDYQRRFLKQLSGHYYIIISFTYEIDCLQIDLQRIKAMSNLENIVSSESEIINVRYPLKSNLNSNFRCQVAKRRSSKARLVEVYRKVRINRQEKIILFF